MNEYDSLRIEKLRKRAVRPQIDFQGMYFDFFRRYSENLFLTDANERYADAFAFALENAKPSIDEGELIVGKPYHPLPECKRAQMESLRPVIDGFVGMNGQDSHMTVDLDLLLSKGIKGVIEMIDGYEAKADESKRSFYECCRKCLQAVCSFSGRYAGKAEKLAAECGDTIRKRELEKIAEICRKVPENGAETFYEAVQSVCFLNYCLSFDPARYYSAQQFQLGRPDRYLLRYYEKDTEEGRLDDGSAQVLLDCMAIQINNRVQRGLSSGYMVGGRDKNGKVVANDLTMMCMQVIDDIRLVYPSVGLCYTKDMPEEYLKKACDILSHGRSHPAVFNDDLITEGLKYYGVPEEEAHDYIHSTCVEITPIASSNIWVASPYTNMPQLLLDILDREYENMDSLYDAYFKHLDEVIRIHLDEQLAMRENRKTHGLHPLLSCFVNDCLERGADIDNDGARYRWIMPSFVGIANLTDCFYAIKKVIFEKKEMTFAELKKYLDSNFEGADDIRARLLEGVEKYGNNIREIDEIFSMITEHITAECEKYRDEKTGFHLVPSAFCWIMHEQFGRETGATPDGRAAGFPLGDGSGACQGREKNGPTSSVLSSTSWKHGKFIGGVAVNMKFTKKVFTKDSCAKVATLIKTYIERGGFEMQINVVDRETLEDARIHPEMHRDLVVRIGGYSDYFVCLSPQMQAEVILRTAHEE
ncbi:MAG: hypothetical protein II748_07660 [Clostridia bacterium]|nr:hypothetical protein [Clostridia bacterium]